jgi:hypothetical protein
MTVVRLGRLASFLLRLAISGAIVMTTWLSPLHGQRRPRTAWAAGINVTHLSDPGTGLCDFDECTLREAILLANTTAGQDWIKIVHSGTLTPVTPLPVITDALIIDATDRSFVVDGGGAFRVFSATAPLTLTHLTIQNGLALEADGGGAYFGATAELTDVTIRANATMGANRGGGAYFAGPATVRGGLFIGNDAGQAGGAYFESTAVVSNTTFISNTAAGGPGGGAFFEQPTWITSTTFASNSASSAGGAHFNNTSVLTGVSFVDNQSQVSEGGGAVLGGTGSVVTGSLFEGNSAQTYGGGLALADSGTGASVNLTTNDIWHNSAELGGGGLVVQADVNASLDNNVIAANTVSAAGAGTELSMRGANAQLVGRHNTLASTAQGSGVALSAGADSVGETVVLTNTIFDGYAVGVAARSLQPSRWTACCGHRSPLLLKVQALR